MYLVTVEELNVVVICRYGGSYTISILLIIDRCNIIYYYLLLIVMIFYCSQLDLSLLCEKKSHITRAQNKNFCLTSLD